MRCIVCKCNLKNCFEEANQPINGLAFATSGHYGTTVFDPMDGSHLEINVCDICIVDAARAGDVLIGQTPPRPRPELNKWEPPLADHQSDAAANTTDQR